MTTYVRCKVKKTLKVVYVVISHHLPVQYLQHIFCKFYTILLKFTKIEIPRYSMSIYR